MTGQGSGVEVDPDELLSIADAIADLLDDVSGDTNATGNQMDFQTNATPSQMATAWTSLFKEDGGSLNDYKVAVYNDQYESISNKYTALVEGLTWLEQACRSTANGYRDTDQQVATNVNQVNQGGPAQEVTG
ncbi:hypothetical protein [Nocardioides litoris]|uniref:hypothetical protein n=1 Tax=Nocardioides litoris TaxID=1926648 RepID=UPI001124416B|nr:hypothetical protein [Nocardioides litoris]